jgi:cytochrome c-type biogenesis protein CcmH/NrfG
MKAEGTPSHLAEIRRAEQFRKEGNPRLAANVLGKVLAKDADHFEANYLLGMLHHHAGNEAIQLIG